MSRLPTPFSPSPITVWAVEDTTAQICWGRLPAGPVGLRAADSVTEIDHPGGPGSILLEGLPAATNLTATLSWDGGSTQLSLTTLTPPPGALIARVATVSDLHIGATRWGFLKTMTEDRAGLAGRFGPESAAFRCARAAIDEARAWGAERVVIKGDAAHHRVPDHFVELGRLVDGFPDVPMSLMPGNHDVDSRSGMRLPDTVGERQLRYIRGVEVHDLPVLRLILTDTTIEGSGIGTLDHVVSPVLDAVRSATTPVLVMTHQQLQPHRILTTYPPGIAPPGSTEFLTDLAAITEDAMVTSGHTHRNRAHRTPVLHTEVASTRDWPGVWAGYAIHEGGIRQVVRRIGAPEAISWHEYSKNAVFGLWEQWAPGTLTDRCLTHAWPNGGTS